MQQEAEQGGDQQERQKVDRQAEQAAGAEHAEAVGQRARGRAAGVGETEALEHDHHRERGKERRHVALGHEPAVDQPDRDAERDPDQKDHRHHEVRGGVERRADHRDGRHQRCDREIEAAHQQHEGLADHDDAERRGLGQHVLDVLGAQEVIGDQRAEADQQGAKDEQAIALEEVARRMPPLGRRGAAGLWREGRVAHARRLRST